MVWVEGSGVVAEGQMGSAEDEDLASLRAALAMAEERRQRAEQRADAAERAKAVFLATISHELRTPLNAILGFSDLMLMDIAGEMSEEQRDYLGHIKHSSVLLLNTVEQMIDLARLATATPALQLGRVSASAVLRRAWQDLAQARRGSLRIQPDWQIAGDEPRIDADAEALRRVFLALLDNADKFSLQDGTVTLAIAPEGEMLRIAIRDRGIGITAEEAGQLMRPFEQKDNSLRRRFEGSGLGLSIAAALIAAHNGALDLSPGEDGIGTAVTVLLPQRHCRRNARSVTG